MQNIARSVLSDEELAKRIIIGCLKDVVLAESRFYHKRLRPRKPSLKKLEMSLISSLCFSSSEPIKGFRAFPAVRSRLHRVGLNNEVRIDHPDVNRAVRTYENIGYLQKNKVTRTTEEYSGVNAVYTETDYLISVKKLVRKLKPRAAIYRILALSGVLERHLRVWNYLTLIKCKHLSVNDAVKLLKAGTTEPILSKDVDFYENIYHMNKEIMRGKSIKQIFEYACHFSRKELIEKNKTWHSDPTYTSFFTRGAIAYNEVQVIYADLR